MSRSRSLAPDARISTVILVADLTGRYRGEDWNAEYEPDPRDLVRELREALGMFAGALPYSPKQAWEEAIAEVRRIRQDRDAAPPRLHQSMTARPNRW